MCPAPFRGGSVAAKIRGMAVPTDFAALFPASAIVAEGGVDLGRALGRFHPLVVHFPIALGLVAIAVEWWRGLSRREGLSPLTLPLLWIAAVAAVAATVTGWVNAAHDHANDSTDTLQLHRWIGTATAVGFVGLAWWGRILAAEVAKAGVGTASAIGTFRWVSLGAGIAMSVTGHLGGDLVHGEGYLTDYLLPRSGEKRDAEPAKSESPAVLTANERFFVDKVRPIIETHCIECHGPKKQKGGLRMDSKAWLFNGPKEKWSVVPGKSAESLLVHRVELDRLDPDSMPPEGDGLSVDEKATLRKWIDDGAEYPATDAAADSARIGSGAAVGGSAAASAGEPQVTAAMRAKADAAAKSLGARGVLVQPIAAGSALLDVNASRADPVLGDGDAGILADMAPVVANLNLSKTALTDAGLAKLAGMRSLERLRLDGTAVGDAGVRALGALPKLESINLIGTKVTPALADWVAAQTALKRIYVWQTALDTPDSLKALASGGRVQAIGADIPLAQPKGPPMPEDPKPGDANPGDPKPGDPKDTKPAG